jgi:hypothetical protein
MKRFILVVLLGLIPQLAFSQADPPPFTKMMEFSKVKKIIEVDTPGGATRVLVTSAGEDPRFVFVFAPGGDGTIDFGTNAEGAIISRSPRNPAFIFALEFLRKQAAWVIIGVPKNYGDRVSIMARSDKEHVEAVARVGLRMRGAYPKSKIILIGHSNGGITAGIQAIRLNPAFDSVVMSAPNLDGLRSWEPEQVRVPLLFITHKEDNCKATSADKTIRAAGDKFPVVVIRDPSPGNSWECFKVPAPHFFSDAYGPYSDAILKWAASL